MGRIFQGAKTNGCWNRYLLPFEGAEVITPKFVAKLIAFATEEIMSVSSDLRKTVYRKGHRKGLR